MSSLFCFVPINSLESRKSQKSQDTKKPPAGPCRREETICLYLLIFLRYQGQMVLIDLHSDETGLTKPPPAPGLFVTVRALQRARTVTIILWAEESHR